ncbi:hypothetical protein ACI2IX_06135 [Leifsonia aquatica]|uniref:hypothetical protein n=1 Tax=Leifsonia aquatica TaxID=144185 RepID=UPI00384B00E7
MNEPSQRYVEVEQVISAHEARLAQDLAVIRLLGRQWAEYGETMRRNTERYEEAGVQLGAQNYFVQRGLAARRELDSYVKRLAQDQQEFLSQTESGLRSASEAESEWLRKEKVRASWA